MRICLKCLVVLAVVLSFESAVSADDLIFIHHSVGQDWLDRGLRDALTAKSYVDSVNEITYGTVVAPSAGRSPSLGDVPGDYTDMYTWIFWFNDYFGAIRSQGASAGFNRIVMFKSCFPNSDIWGDGAEPGDPFGVDKILTNYRAVYRHPAGSGGNYQFEGHNYHALADIFAAHPDILFIPVTSPPLTWEESNDANAHRARLFTDWLKNDWLSAYNSAHPTLHNVAVFDLFNELAYPDNHSSHPNRLRQEYGGNSDDAHPNEAADARLTQVFATSAGNFIDLAWEAFNGGAPTCTYTITPSSRDHEAAAGDGTIEVSTSSTCSWTVRANDSWITVPIGNAGSGDGTVHYSISANTEPDERTGTLTVAGWTFTIRQAAGQPPPPAPPALLFPAFFKGIHASYASSFVGVAVSNPTDADNWLSVEGLSEAGISVSQKSLTSAVPGLGQKAFLTSEVIDAEAGARTLIIKGDAGPLRGFFMIGEGSLKRLDGVGYQWDEDTVLYFPLAKRVTGGETTVYVHNPGTGPSAANFTWVGQDGKTISQASITIPARGAVMRTIGQLFPASSVSGDGYVKLTADQPLTGCLVYCDAEAYVALPASSAASVPRLLAPHFYVPAAGGGTELRLINTGTDTVSVRVRAYKDGEEAALGDESRDVAAGALWVVDLGTLLKISTQGLPPGGAHSGYVDLEIKTKPLGLEAPVIGSVVFSGNNRQFSAALPLIREGSRQTLFPHVAQSAVHAVFTGLAVLNPGAEGAEVSVAAFNPAGEETARQDFWLDPGERAVDLLNGAAFFGASFSQNGGYLRLWGSQPLVSFALFGESTLAYMAAIGGQGIEE